MKEGVEKKLESTWKGEWDIADNGDFWTDKCKGNLVVGPTRGGKPFYYYSMAEIEKEHPRNLPNDDDDDDDDDDNDNDNDDDDNDNDDDDDDEE